LIESKISKRYARALMSIGKEDHKYAIYGENLCEFAMLCKENKEFFGVISNNIFSLEDRIVIIDKVLEKNNFEIVVNNFLRLLILKGRINAIVEISEYYSILVDEVNNITRAVLSSPNALKVKVKERLLAALEKFTGKIIIIVEKQNKALIGGVVVKIGDLVIDGSIRTQLVRLTELLKRGR